MYSMASATVSQVTGMLAGRVEHRLEQGPLVIGQSLG
jgi:hypothetical protein